MATTKSMGPPRHPTAEQGFGIRSRRYEKTMHLKSTEMAAAPVLSGEDSAGTPASERMVIVRPVVNAIRILRYLGELGAPARAITISRALSINASTCFNILRTLTLERIVEFDPMAKTYSSGLGLARLVENFLTEGQRISATIPHMTALAGKHSITAALWKRVTVDRIILVKSIGSPTDVRIEMAEGQRLPLLMGATGRLFAPRLGLTRRELRVLFKQLHLQRSLTFEEYWKQVEDSLKIGWAIDDGYFTSGVKSLGVPICDQSGSVTFTLVAIMFQSQMDDDRLRELGETMKALAPKLASILT